MTQAERRIYLIKELLAEQAGYSSVKVSTDPDEQKRLLRSLCNVRMPGYIRTRFLTVQNEYLREELAQKGVVEVADLTPVVGGLYLWQGDITRLEVDAIVNAANSALLGCFCPCHGCIDNAVHSAAGLQLRNECNEIMRRQGYPESNGRAKLTNGYNLPAKYVLHTVGPIIQGQVTQRDRQELASCYRSCLDLAAAHGLESIAFCCISTGEFHFPNQEAAEIAVSTVTEFLRHSTSIQKVIFNVFKDIDAQIYRTLLRPDQTAETGA